MALSLASSNMADDGEGAFSGCGGCSRSKRPKQQIDGAAFTSDTVLAAEMNKLSFLERERVYEELHGVDQTDAKVETTEFVTEKIQEMQEAVAKMPQQKRKDYDRAMFLNPGLKHDTAFFLLFLRTEEYDVRLAAKRICVHFTDKMALWGEERLAKRITLHDLDEGDIYSLRGGCFRFLETKDRSGRLIFLGQCDKIRYHTWINHHRMYWYTMMSRYLDEPENHARGIVRVVNGATMNSENLGCLVESLRNGAHFQENIPVRLRGQHICYNNAHFRAAVSFWERILSKNLVLRTRFHYGSILEARYSLLSFGIQIDPIHLSQNLEEQERIMDQYLEEQRRKEARLHQAMEEMVAQGRIPYPSSKDILVGRSPQYHGFPGNVHMDWKVQEQAAQYSRLEDRLDKTVFAMSMVKTFQEEGRRFLQRMDDHWAIVDDQVASRKVGQALRLCVKRASS